MSLGDTLPNLEKRRLGFGVNFFVFLVLEELHYVLEHLDGLPRLFVHLLVGASYLCELHVHLPPGLVVLVSKLPSFLFVSIVNAALDLGKLCLVMFLDFCSLLNVTGLRLVFSLSCLLWLTFAVIIDRAFGGKGARLRATESTQVLKLPIDLACIFLLSSPSLGFWSVFLPSWLAELDNLRISNHFLVLPLAALLSR